MNKQLESELIMLKEVSMELQQRVETERAHREILKQQQERKNIELMQRE